MCNLIGSTFTVVRVNELGKRARVMSAFIITQPL